MAVQQLNQHRWGVVGFTSVERETKGVPNISICDACGKYQVGGLGRLISLNQLKALYSDYRWM